MVRLSKRTRRGLTEAILVPGTVGLLTLLLLVLHQVVATVA
jgi:hypothetical protein